MICPVSERSFINLYYDDHLTKSEIRHVGSYWAYLRWPWVAQVPLCLDFLACPFCKCSAFCNLVSKWWCMVALRGFGVGLLRGTYSVLYTRPIYPNIKCYLAVKYLYQLGMQCTICTALFPAKRCLPNILLQYSWMRVRLGVLNHLN